jgi:hypothetical protein
VLEVGEDALTARSAGRGARVRITRRMLAEARPFVAAGRPLPAKLRSQAGRLTAILNAAGVGDADWPTSPIRRPEPDL